MADDVNVLLNKVYGAEEDDLDLLELFRPRLPLLGLGVLQNEDDLRQLVQQRLALLGGKYLRQVLPFLLRTLRSFMRLLRRLVIDAERESLHYCVNLAYCLSEIKY